MNQHELGGNRTDNKTSKNELLFYVHGDNMPLYKIIPDESPNRGDMESLLSSDDELFVSRNLGEVTNFGEVINSMRKPKLGDPQKIGNLQIAQDSTSNRWYIIDSLGHPISPGFDEEITLTNQEDVYGITLRRNAGVLAKLQPEAQKVIGRRSEL